MDKVPSLFERFLYEAPGGDPPDAPAGTGPPEMPDDAAVQDTPPDMPGLDDLGSGDDGDGMPDMGGFDDGGGDDAGGFGGEGDTGEGGEGDQEGQQELQLDDKVNAIMNMQLYQRYLALLNTIGSQLTMIKNNSDILYTLSADSLDVIEQLKKLDENVRLYLKNSFLHENYSKNLLFFNKCLNLLHLLNEDFDGNVQKGIKSME